jgi:hypothetical protein
MKKILFKSVVLNNGLNKINVSVEILSQLILLSIRNLKARFYTDVGTINHAQLRNYREYLDYKNTTNNLQDYYLNELTESGAAFAYNWYLNQ